MFMKKRIIPVVILTFALTLVLFHVGFSEGEGECTVIDFELVGSSEYDRELLYAYWDAKEGTPITYWRLAAKEKVEDLSGKEGFQFPDDLNAAKKIYVLSYGREIESIDGIHTDDFCTGNTILEVTFKEPYQGNKLFIYSPNDGSCLEASFASPCYIMRGEEKVFWVKDVDDLVQYKEDVDDWEYD